jgi:hypothetical protein
MDLYFLFIWKIVYLLSQAIKGTKFMLILGESESKGPTYKILELRLITVSLCKVIRYIYVPLKSPEQAEFL